MAAIAFGSMLRVVDRPELHSAIERFEQAARQVSTRRLLAPFDSGDVCGIGFDQRRELHESQVASLSCHPEWGFVFHVVAQFASVANLCQAQNLRGAL